MRRGNHVLGQWWWSIDRYMVGTLILLMAIGAVLVTAASPAVAERINLESFYFVKRQYVYLLFSLGVMAVLSSLSLRDIRRIGMLGLVASFFLLLLVPVLGTEVKGATRWISLFGLSIQPSEFAKPFFAITTAWLFTIPQRVPGFPAFRASLIVYAVFASLLISQPDLGMTVTLSVIWGVQLFLAGLPLIWVLGLALLGAAGLLGAYHWLPHVTSRIDRFLDPASGDNYQVDKSIEAFQSGGLIGRGPGEGVVKLSLPDSHTDFIFAVAAEEFGILFCLLLIALFLFLIIRPVQRVWQSDNLFVLLAVAGLLTQFAMQALINMGVAVQMFPAKGMTLPFLSYGGSSALSIALCMGMILALTRKRME